MNTDNKPTRVLGTFFGWRAKESASCRMCIVDQGLRPLIEHDRWRPGRAEYADGSPTNLTDSLAKQMAIMLREGYWPKLSTPEMHERAERALKRERLSRRQERYWYG